MLASHGWGKGIWVYLVYPSLQSGRRYGGGVPPAKWPRRGRPGVSKGGADREECYRSGKVSSITFFPIRYVVGCWGGNICQGVHHRPIGTALAFRNTSEGFWRPSFVVCH